MRYDRTSELRKHIAEAVGDAFLAEVGRSGKTIAQACREMHADYPSIDKILGKKVPITMLHAVKMLAWSGAEITVKMKNDQVGCGYCIHEKVCTERKPDVNKARLGCSKFRHFGIIDADMREFH